MNIENCSQKKLTHFTVVLDKKHVKTVRTKVNADDDEMKCYLPFFCFY